MIQQRSVRDELLGTASTAIAKSGFREIALGGKKVDVAEFLLRALETYQKEKALHRAVALGLPELAPIRGPAEAKAVRRLVQAFAQEKDTATRGFLLLGLAEIAREHPDRAYAFQVIRQAIQTERNREVQAFAALAAGLASDREALPALRLLFVREGSSRVRSAAALALGLLCDRASHTDLVREIGGKCEPSLKGYCCLALGMMGEGENPEAYSALRKILLENNVPEVRAAAAVALARLGAKDALELLLGTLTAESRYFRMTAVMAVSQFRDEKTLKPLMDLYRSPRVNDEERAIVLTALGNVADASEVPALKRLASRADFLAERFRVLQQIMRLL